MRDSPKPISPGCLWTTICEQRAHHRFAVRDLEQLEHAHHRLRAP